MTLTIQTKYFLIALVVVASLLLTFSYTFLNSRAVDTVSLHFEAVVDDAPLVFNQTQYPNPGGEGEFQIRSFLFYISNISLIGDSSTYVETDSYHLARFDNESNSFTIELDNVPRQRIEKIEFSIGVDASANNSIMPMGDLDPNSRMAWSWDVGYKFILFEGRLAVDETLLPLVYHVGFDENYQTMVFDLDQSLDNDPLESAYFKVDIMRLFAAATTIDMTELSNVKFDRTDAQLLANNYKSMIMLK